MRLTYRNYFIDVEEGEKTQHSPGSLRARSVPTERTRRFSSFSEGAEEELEREKDVHLYVDGLTDRLALDVDTNYRDNHDHEDAAFFQAPPPPAPFLGSLGSFGHPELCGRPCIHFITERCEKGYNCNFCHIEHDKKNVKLDKKQRTLIKTLGLQRLAEMVAPLCRERFEACQLDGSKILEILEEFARAPAPPVAAAEHDLKYLRRTMARMNLSCILSIFIHQHGDQGHGLTAAIEELRQTTGLP